VNALPTGKASAAIADPATENFVSAVSTWEIVTKWRSGKEPRFVPMAVPILRATMRHA
jgi:PIN domain nuclease of toxin-antitoxin system